MVGEQVSQGIGFLKFFKYTFIVIFVLALLANAINISIKEKSVMPAIQDLGSRFIGISSNLHDLSQKLISSEKMSLKDSFFTYLGLYENLFIFYIWILVLYKLFNWSPLSTGQPFASLLLAILTFILMQSFYLLIFTKPAEGVSLFSHAFIPILVFKDLANIAVVLSQKVIGLFK